GILNFVFVFVFVSTASSAMAEEAVTLGAVVTEDMTLSGEILISEDVLIPEGVTLTLLSGAQVLIVPSEGTRTDPQFLTTETEIMVHGSLLVPRGPVSFRSRGSTARGTWGGITMASDTARAAFTRTTIEGAETALMVLAGEAVVAKSIFRNNEVGIASGPAAKVTLQSNRYIGNGIGTVTLNNDGSDLRGPGDRFEDNEEDTLIGRADDITVSEPFYRTVQPQTGPAPPITREYLGEVALDEDTRWSGTVIVEGQVAVPRSVTLVIDPGTHVLFRFRDTNDDGLGESWIIVQGRIDVRGKEDKWVLFDAEDENASPGAWDSLSVIASDAEDNMVQYAVFRRGVKAFHNHFSTSTLDHVVFEDNLRGVQFQESEGTSLSWGTFRNNRSAMRFRDSVVGMRNLVVEDNLSGINFLRSTVRAEDLYLGGNLVESLVARESETSLNRALFTANRRGPRFKGEGENIDLTQLLVTASLTEGLSLNEVNARIKQSDLSGNGLTGLSVTDASVVVRSSRLADNGRFEVDNNGSTEIDARGNDWGTGATPSPEATYDGTDQEGIGKILTDGPRVFNLVYPGIPLPAGSIQGSLVVVGDVTFPADRTLNILPGTQVALATIPQDSLFDLCSDHPSFPSSELIVAGRLAAEGTGDEPVTFTPTRPAKPIVRMADEVPDDSGALWGAINLTGSKGGTLKNCIISGASTGVHAREADRFEIQGCLLSDNQVGLRFSKSDVSIRNNAFRNNVTGLRFHDFGGTVSNNQFIHNATAIFVTDNPREVTLKDNIFKGSIDYHIKLGIHVTDDVTLEGGVFEVPDGIKIEDLVFDKEDDEDLGKVILEKIDALP
ncbi:hypothetical protein EP232_06340, partial [bacterium]